eukprot:gene8900-8989_t
MNSATPLKIAVGADHAGFQMKNTLVAWLQAQGHDVHDFGTNGPESVDYPDYSHVVCEAVTSGAARFGVLVCGTGLAKPPPPGCRASTTMPMWWRSAPA